jgi:putative membrane protein (TIGR04086 family)
MSNIKWGRVVLGIVLAIIVALVVPILYVTVRMVIIGFQGGSPDAEAQKEVVLSTSYAVVALVAAVLGGFLGGRLPARKAEGSYLLNGLLVGLGTAILLAVWTFVQSSSFSLGTLLHVAMAIGGSLLGGWLGGRAAEAEAYD